MMELQKKFSSDRNLSRRKNNASLSFYSQLFCEIVNYNHNKSKTVDELHDYLHKLGKNIGSRLIDQLSCPDRSVRREIRVLNYLLYLKNTVWKYLYGEEADYLEEDVAKKTTYYFIEKDSIYNRYNSNADTGANLAYISAGILESMLSDAGFSCKVVAHWYRGTTFIIEFEEGVIQRDKALTSKK